MPNPSVTDILKQWLKANGYDGLYNRHGCGCLLEDLVPCIGEITDCQAGYRRDGCDDDCFIGECDWHVGPKQ